MRDRWKLVLTLAGAASVGVAVRDAVAGNLAGDVTNASYRNFVSYYGVSLTFGQFLDWNGPTLPAGSCWTVDDITYVMDVDPEEPAYWSGQLFDMDTLFVNEQQVDVPFNYAPASNGNYKILHRQPPNNANNYLIRWARARGTGFNAFLYNGPSSITGARVFDSVSHTAWGQVVGREKVDLQHLDPYAFSTTSLSTWAVETSESRRYQTPEIVQMENGVTFLNEGRALATGGLSRYKFGRVHLKGRVFSAAPGGAVTPVTDVTPMMRILP